MRSGTGRSDTVTAGSTSRFMPTTKGPIPTPIRLLNTGSVRIAKQSTRIRTVLCPIQAVWRVVLQTPK